MSEQIDKICREMNEVLGGHIGRTNVTPHTLAAIARDLAAVLPSVRKDDAHLRFTHGDSRNEIVPANFYTTLRCALGDAAPSFEECDAVGFYMAPDGTAYEWRNGSTFVTVPTPMHVITFNVEEMKS